MQVGELLTKVQGCLEVLGSNLNGSTSTSDASSDASTLPSVSMVIPVLYRLQNTLEPHATFTRQ